MVNQVRPTRGTSLIEDMSRKAIIRLFIKISVGTPMFNEQVRLIGNIRIIERLSGENINQVRIIGSTNS